MQAFLSLELHVSEVWQNKKLEQEIVVGEDLNLVLEFYLSLFIFSPLPAFWKTQIPASGLHFRSWVTDVWEVPVFVWYCLSSSFFCSSREEDRAKATMVSSSRASGFFLGFFRACRPGLVGPFLLVPTAWMLKKKMARVRCHLSFSYATKLSSDLQ